ncbi:hypothetical protein SCY21_22515, partial [Xanthomonas euvesicatoria]|uniref:hypothetical protein n=1 Tax=Xanthomonas euvesicatoria TaxID=456327 RepID=UPI00298D8E0E
LGLLEHGDDLAVGKAGLLHGTSSGKGTRKFHFWRLLIGGGITVAYDVFQRFELDVGQHIQDNAPTVSEGLARLKEVKDYVRQTVSASFRKLRESGRGLTDANVSQAVREALRDTFEVFEGYME